ncbi:MAG TPA: DUF642 domain-containing protein [Ktedonobacteraceae bacterium]|nr:DUF642 domain-containing protein [Ktedonobacteraceae bacterium]
MSMFSQPSTLRPHLGAFGTETDRRLVLLLFAIIAASLYILHIELATTFLQGMFAHCLQTSLANPGLDFNALTPDGLPQVCSVVPERWQSLGMLLGLLLLLGLAVLVYWFAPRWKIWRVGLMPLEQYQQATIVRNGERVHIVTFLEKVQAAYLPGVRLRYVSNRRATAQRQPSVFGGPGQAYLLVPFASITLFQQDTAAFQVSVLHELAHFYHRDVQKVHFARALTLAFALLILLPFLAFTLWSLAFAPTSLAPLAKMEFVLSQFWGTLVMAGLVWLLYRAALRSREMAADVQASYWAGTDAVLAGVLQKLDARRAWWQVALSDHPDQRALNVQEPGRLFRLRYWEALATGITASLVLPTSYFTAMSLFSALNLTGLSLPGLVLVGVVGSLLLCGLVVAVIGQMTWRAMLLVKLRGGGQLVGTGRVGLCLAAGLVLGFLFSLQFTPFLVYYHINWQTLAVYFGPWLLGLALGLAGFCRWLAVLAGTWLEVIDGPRMARRVSSVNLAVASVVLATGLAVVALLCLTTLGYLFPQGIDYHALLKPVELQATDVLGFYWLMLQWLVFDFLPLPGVALGLTVLWVLPLLSWLWYRQRTPINRYVWALADARQQAPSTPAHSPFKWGLLGETALVLGVLFCALFLLFHRVSLALASAEQLYPYALALTALPLVVAALWQGGLAALLYREARGIVNGLVGAFLAGLVIAAGCFLVYGLFGGTLGYPVAGDQFWPFCLQVLAWGSIGAYALLLALDSWPGKGQRRWASATVEVSSLETSPLPAVKSEHTRSGGRTSHEPRDGSRRRRWLWPVSLLLIIIALLLPRYASKPTPVAFTGIVKNGDFEVPVAPVGQFNEYYAGHAFGGWTVAAGSIDLVNQPYWQAGHGNQSVDMDGDSAGTIYQDLPTRAGATYTLSFLLAANPECGDTVKVLQIWWSGNLLDTIQVSPHGHNNQHMGWHNSLIYAAHTAVNLKFPYVVRASANVTRLEFISLTPGNCGAVIDLVSVVETSVG